MGSDLYIIYGFYISLIWDILLNCTHTFDLLKMFFYANS